MKRVVVIGGGFGGLAVAAELARAGLDVTVLEAHIYAGGCAGTFYHQGYRFDAGATLAGGFLAGAPMEQLGRHFGIDWGAFPSECAMDVRLPDGTTIRRWTEADRWKQERQAFFGKEGEPFWEWQERTARILWSLALRLPSWPPQTLMEVACLARMGLFQLLESFHVTSPGHLIGLAADAFRPVSAHLSGENATLRQFVDGQLLISAQALSGSANALYGAAALDLPHLGVGYVPGGMGGMADQLVKAIRRFGGRVFFRQEVQRVRRVQRGLWEIESRRDKFPADVVIFNLPPWNIGPLVEGQILSRLRKLANLPRDGWGAFVLYVGVDQGILGDENALHYQLIAREPMGEGNTAFLSFSPAWDKSRAPAGRRALTISTHTRLEPWWELYAQDRQAYEQRKQAYMGRLLDLAEGMFPGLREASDLVMAGTPVTFARFTRRFRGWVGGFPQTHLFRAWGPRLAPNLWMVGDSIFPGQSVPAVMLGGLRVAKAILDPLRIEAHHSLHEQTGQTAKEAFD